MATKIDFQLIPLERDSLQPFDFSQLPFSIMPNVEVADVSELLPPSMFNFLKAGVGSERMRFFESTLKHALVHRYDDPPMTTNYEESATIGKRNDWANNQIMRVVLEENG